MLNLFKSMKIQAFATKNLTESIVAFAQFVRSHGLNIGIEETQLALLAANEQLLTSRKYFKSALKTIFCTSPEEGIVYERLFSLFWDTNPVDLKEEKNKRTIQGVIEKKTNASLVMLGQGKTADVTQEAKSVSGANEMERLRHTDFSKLSEIDAGILDEISQKLFRQMALRLRRRMKENRRYGKINLRRTIRRSIPFGGEPIDLYHIAQKPKKQRLIVLLDVSGSMDKYSFFLLRFICALRENFRQLEAFVFSTSLIRITKALQPNNLEWILTNISAQVNNWSGGTKIGECLQVFNEKFGKQLLNGSPTILIISDGLDTGSPEVLGKELLKMQMRAKRIVWLNPLKGMKGYEPLAKGMKTALPLIDDFCTAHNLESLLELEKILINV
jgi:uncharacterized protein with von Willebrand factor type A (vWA) domain